MYKLSRLSFILLFGFITLLTSCEREDLSNPWVVFFHEDFERSQQMFVQKLMSDDMEKSDFIGLAYTYSILDNGDWMNTLERYSENADTLWWLSHLTVAMTNHFKDSTAVEFDFNFEQIKAFHLGTAFDSETDLGGRLTGQYRDMKEVGTWVEYDAEGNVVREVDFDE